MALFLFGLGIGAGAYGTIVGAGGGFVLMPVLLYLYPQESVKTITSISLAVVALNALSGTLAYARLRRIDVKSGIWFALTSVPGAIVGALITTYLSRALFHFIFGVLVLVIATFLLVRPKTSSLRTFFSRGQTRQLTDRNRTTYRYAFNLPAGVAMSFGVGILSSLMGIGGGIVQVPLLTSLFGFPTLVATATSQFVLTNTAFAGTITHILTGEFTTGWRRVLFLSAGAIIGAQFGARLSSRLGGTMVIRFLALALAAVGLRLILG